MDGSGSGFSESRPLRVAIVGAGPSGFYAAEALFGGPIPVEVDVFDRLPTPFGLVRGGVAPDHQSIKRVIQVYERVAADPRFRFFGHVTLGKDIQVGDLKAHYDAIIYAVGNESDRKLGLPGEDLPGCHSATEFVGWYNGHPDFREHSFDLSAEDAVIIGVGNVAMDVARILGRDPEELSATDIAGHTMPALQASKIKRIHLLGRRGPAQAAFSPKEIKELGKLSNAQLVVDPAQAALDPNSQLWLDASGDRAAAKNVAYLQEVAANPGPERPVEIRLHFFTSPTEFVAGADGRVNAVRVEHTEIRLDAKGLPRPEATGETSSIPAGVVFKAVGYRGVALPGVPFHARWGIIPNVSGRVVTDLESQTARPGEYVVGWAKRGPTGLIGTNKPDAIETVQCLLKDAAEHPPTHRALKPEREATPALLKARGVAFVRYVDWKQLDLAEVNRGEEARKIREKFTRVDEMLRHLERERGEG